MRVRMPKQVNNNYYYDCSSCSRRGGCGWWSEARTEVVILENGKCSALLDRDRHIIKYIYLEPNSQSSMKHGQNDQDHYCDLVVVMVMVVVMERRGKL